MWLHPQLDCHHMKIVWLRTSRGMGLQEPDLRKDMGAEGAKAVPLRWIDTDKGDAGRPNTRSRVVVRARRH